MYEEDLKQINGNNKIHQQIEGGKNKLKNILKKMKDLCTSIYF